MTLRPPPHVRPRRAAFLERHARQVGGWPPCSDILNPLVPNVPDKLRERYYFEALRTALPEIPPGEPLEPEPPDFLLRTEHERLGIELTSFHLPPPPGERPHQERQSLKDRIVAIAERLHHETGGPALYVSVFFNAHTTLDKRDIQALARGIADSVLRAPKPESMDKAVELPWGRRPEATSGILIFPSEGGKDKLWHADAGGYVAAISADQIARVVQAKARRAPLARTRCDKLWLVVVNDAFSRAAPAEISAEARRATYEGPFDRLIWLLPSQPARAIDLRLTSSLV